MTPNSSLERKEASWVKSLMLKAARRFSGTSEMSITSFTLG